MGTFADKFEQALSDSGQSLRGLARKLARDDGEVETIRRRLYKYRPRPGGGAAEVAPSDQTRWNIEEALGLQRDALAPDPEIPRSRELDAALEVVLRELLRTQRVAA